jgi:hypothetical protein
MARATNPNLLCGFFYKGLKQKLIYGVGLWMLTEETLESDTKMIRGGPIFSVNR